MKDKELVFDWKMQVCYSLQVKNVIRHIKKHCSNREAEVLWERIQNQYVEFLKALPFLGGRIKEV